jgi:hypothetical protein
MQTLEELVDEITDSLMESICGDNDLIEEKLEDYAIDHGIFNPGDDIRNEDAERMIEFEGSTMLRVWERLALQLLIERDKILRKQMEDSEETP